MNPVVVPVPTVRVPTVRYAGDEMFIATTASGHAIAVDTKSDRKAAPGPLELFLAGIACCTATDVISVLLKKRLQVSSYHVEIHTQRREEHPRRFERIELKHIIRGTDVPADAVARAIELSSTKYCSAIATVRPTAEVVSSFVIEAETVLV